MAEVENPAVSKVLLQEVSHWRDQGVGWKDIICRLRVRTVPFGYTHSPWKPGKPHSLYKGAKVLLRKFCLLHCMLSLRLK